ncbi:tRNA (adenosine(37)-N6)-threonylcarbamoyltransferase complex dimerization subunit type 1 TsaB [Candidatus Phytoplasma oryzae]|nr:tRNA (adenosine(37)-N6)-threonylcarbamoyltransferase complex dimerization subunit type 1 TsaB [Candidatus Phytoplasma oryzae]
MKIKKKYLILDISIKVQIVILTTENKIIDIIKKKSSTKIVEKIIPLIDKIIKKNNIELKNLNGIIVGIGPGSFIGTRVAVLTSKIISLGMDIPLYKISSLTLLTSGYINNKNIITPKICACANNNFFYSTSFKYNQIILNENIYNYSFLNKFDNHLLININNIKISVPNIFFYMKKVINPHKLVPIYYK